MGTYANRCLTLKFLLIYCCLTSNFIRISDIFLTSLQAINHVNEIDTGISIDADILTTIKKTGDDGHGRKSLPRNG